MSLRALDRSSKSCNMRRYCFGLMINRCHLSKFLFSYLVAILLSEVRGLSNYPSGYHEEHFCEVILNQEMSLKDISYLGL